VHRGRALAVLVVAVLLGVLMLQVGNRPPVGGPGTAVSAHSASSASAASSTATTVPRASVVVLVENGTSVKGAAGTYARYLQRQGWKVLPATDTTASTAATSVYYAPGQRAGAAQLARALGLPATSVTALTTSAPLGTTTGADVVLALGPAQADHPPAISG